MNCKKMFRVLTLGAAFAIATCNPSAAMPEVKAAEIVEETGAYAGLDEILRQAYAAFVGQDYLSICALDLNDATRAFAEQVRASGADRYVCDIDGNTKAMLYTPADGGYWWYFGQMENGLRQGSGTTFACNSETSYAMFSGVYTADAPIGEGKMTRHYTNADVSFKGSFQGAYLNGTYQVDYTTAEHGTSSIMMPYANNQIQNFTGYELNTNEEVGFDVFEWEGSKSTYFWIGGSDIAVYGTAGWEFVMKEEDVEFGDEIVIPEGYDGFLAFGLYYDAASDRGESDAYANWLYITPDELVNGLSVLRGNADGVALVSSAAGQQTPAQPTVPEQPAQEVPTPVLPEVEVPVTQEQPTATPATYTVERGDNLCKIAEKIYGDRDLYTLIYEANKDVIKKNYVIFANQVLVIPAR